MPGHCEQLHRMGGEGRPAVTSLPFPISLLFHSPFCPGSAGMRSSYASQHSQLGQDLRSTISPDRHIAPIYEDRTFQGPLYRSPSHNQQGTLYRSSSGWHHTIKIIKSPLWIVTFYRHILITGLLHFISCPIYYPFKNEKHYRSSL